MLSCSLWLQIPVFAIWSSYFVAKFHAFAESDDVSQSKLLRFCLLSVSFWAERRISADCAGSWAVDIVPTLSPSLSCSLFLSHSAFSSLATPPLPFSIPAPAYDSIYVDVSEKVMDFLWI